MKKKNEKEKNQLLLELPYKYNHRTLSVWKNFSKIFIQLKDIAQSSSLIDSEKHKKTAKNSLFYSQLAEDFVLYLLIEEIFV